MPLDLDAPTFRIFAHTSHGTWYAVGGLLSERSATEQARHLRQSGISAVALRDDPCLDYYVAAKACDAIVSMSEGDR